MDIFYSAVLTAQVLSAIAIIVLVLMQHGKGADMGASFGSGASGSLFGATGSANFLSKATAIAATIFFCTTLGLAYLSKGRGVSAPASVMDKVPPAGAPAVPGAVPPAAVPPSAVPNPAIPPSVAPAPAATPAPPATPATPSAVTPAPAVAPAAGLPATDKTGVAPK